MAKLVLLTDTHFGARNDSDVFAQYFAKFYNNVFFPYLEENNITTLIHLGDVVDRRKFINYKTLRYLREGFVYRLGEMGIDTHILIGNHDAHYKDTNDINSMRELFTTFDGKYEPWIYSRPNTVTFDGTPILFIPWITKDNREDTFDLIDTTSAEIVMAHLELNGFEMYSGYSTHDGDDPNPFRKFDMVMSGHFHHKSDDGTIYYLGAPYEMTWSDYQDARGFHVFDTATRELIHIRNPYRMFHKVFYNDQDKTFEDVVNQDFSAYENTCVKLVVQNKTNPYYFDMVVDQLYKANPYKMSIVEDYSAISITSKDINIDQAEDTLTILDKYIDNAEMQGDKPALKTLIHTLYSQAMAVDLDS